MLGVPLQSFSSIGKVQIGESGSSSDRVEDACQAQAIHERPSSSA